MYVEIKHGPMYVDLSRVVNIDKQKSMKRDMICSFQIHTH